MKMIIAVALAGVCVLVAACTVKKTPAEAEKPPVRFVSAVEFQSLINANGPHTVLVDVRTPQEFAEGHIAGARNIDFYGKDFKDQFAALGAENTYLLYCRSGRRTRTAAAQLGEMGFKNIVVLDKGIEDWQANTLPIER